MARAKAATAPKGDPWLSRIVGDGEADPTELMAHPGNWRTHPDAQQEALASTLERVGYVTRIIVNKTTGHIVDGHLRVEMALAHGQPQIPVTFVELTADEEAVILATLDPIGDMAAINRERLRALVEQIDARGDTRLADLLATLRTQSRIQRFLDDPDAAPALRTVSHIKAGDVWQLGPHRLAVGDCRDTALLARLSDGYPLAQCVFTDPPYGVDYAGGMKPRTKLAGDTSTTLYEEALRRAQALVAEDAAWYVWYAANQAETALAGLRNAGLTTIATIVWVKNMVSFARGHYRWQHEPLAYAKGKRSPSWYGGSAQTTVWEADRPSKNEFHPTQKPVALAERAITNSTRVGDVVFDGFGGSGSTLIAAGRLERRCLMVELDPAYADVIVRRWQDSLAGGEPVKL